MKEKIKNIISKLEENTNLYFQNDNKIMLSTNFHGIVSAYNSYGKIEWNPYDHEDDEMEGDYYECD